jgi:glycosyltransferase involved in cell wall biosynthesis
MLVREMQRNANITLYAQANQGVSVARNAGIKRSSGDLIAFLDADDKWDSCHLSDIHALSMKFPNAALLATGSRHMFGDGRLKAVTWSNTKPTLMHDYFEIVSRPFHPITLSAAAVRKDALVEVGYFTEGVAVGEDQELWARIALRFPVAYHPNISVTYTVDAENSALAKNKWSQAMPHLVHALTCYTSSVSDNKYQVRALTRYRSWLILNHVARGLAVGKQVAGLALISHPETAKHFPLRWARLICASIVPGQLLEHYMRRMRRG